MHCNCHSPVDDDDWFDCCNYRNNTVANIVLLFMFLGLFFVFVFACLYPVNWREPSEKKRLTV